MAVSRCLLVPGPKSEDGPDAILVGTPAAREGQAPPTELEGQSATTRKRSFSSWFRRQRRFRNRLLNEQCPVDVLTMP